MNVYDSLHGCVEVEEWLLPVFKAPEMQRLRDVRLINTTATSIPALSDVRRFSHTIGVLHLAKQLISALGLNTQSREAKTFVVASMLHDVATPPFGHLFEYLLLALFDWHHERFVDAILRGNYRFERRYHQIYYNKQLSLYNALDAADVDPDDVAKLVRGEGALGRILSGSLDLDNLDNVFRMALHLGLAPDVSQLTRMVRRTRPDSDGVAYYADALGGILHWRDLRRDVYEILAFDEYCLSSEAMLTEALTTALRNGILKSEAWYLSDESLLRLLAAHSSTSSVARRYAVGDYYQVVFRGWYKQPKCTADLRHPDAWLGLAEDLSSATGIPCVPYVFYDSGTFAKELAIRLADFPAGGAESHQVSKESQSTIVCVTTPRRAPAPHRVREIIVGVLEGAGLAPNNIAPIPTVSAHYGLPEQTQFAI